MLKEEGVFLSAPGQFFHQMLHKEWMLFFSSALETSFDTEPFFVALQKSKGWSRHPKIVSHPHPLVVFSVVLGICLLVTFPTHAEAALQ